MKKTKKVIKAQQFLSIQANENYSKFYQICKYIDRDLARIGGGRLAGHKAGVLGECLLISGGDYLEVGSQFGGSALLAATATDGHVWCIDPMEDLPADDEVYGNVNEGKRGHSGESAIFHRNMKHYGVDDRVTLIQQSSIPWPEFDEPLAVGTSYVDGNHSYEYALSDIRNVAPLTSHFIVVDDYIHWPDVRKATHTFLREQDEFDLVYADYSIAVLAKNSVIEEFEVDELALVHGGPAWMQRLREERSRLRETDLNV